MPSENYVPNVEAGSKTPFYNSEIFGKIVFWALVVALCLFGGLLSVGGVILIASGGNFYYAIAGILQIAAGVQMVRRRQSAIHIYAFYFLLTWLWALMEVGFNGWGLLPRVNMACLLMPFLLLPVINAQLKPDALR
jgi:quinoprotein glucose dehydrogenase